VKYFIGFIVIFDVKGLQHNHMSAHYVTVVKGLVKLSERQSTIQIESISLLLAGDHINMGLKPGLNTNPL